MTRLLQIIAIVVVAAAFGAAGWTLQTWFWWPKHVPLICYPTVAGKNPGTKVVLTDQFPTIEETLTVGPSNMLCMPAVKNLPKGKTPFPVKNADHLLCYLIDTGNIVSGAIINDQFGEQAKVHLQQAKYLCEPADKMEVTGSAPDDPT